MNISDVVAGSAVDRAADLTQHEIQGLATRFNLSDAHTHQGQAEAQRQIVDSLPDLWYEAENGLQAEFEEKFLDSFFRLHGQPTPLRKNKTMLSYSASTSTMVAAMFLRQHRMAVSLIEPCFDNLHDVLVNMGVPLYPIAEELFGDVDRIYDNLVRDVKTEALFLVEPNNPTGFSLLSHGRRGLEEVVRYCRDHRKLLLIDFCFASFTLNSACGRDFDVYEMLEDSGVSYLVIEDTGKTWPVQDAKAAMLTPSDDIRAQVFDLHTSVLLNVSPFVLNMLSSYVETSIVDGMASVHDLLARNTATLRRELDGSILEFLPPLAQVSVAWLRIVHPLAQASRLQAAVAAEQGVYMLPGTYFYWSEPSRGEDYVRIALAREPGMFAEAMTRLRVGLDRHAG